MRRPLALLAIALPATFALWRLGSRFPLPRRDVGGWLVDVGPAEAAMSVLRLGALGAAFYLAVIALLHGVEVPTWSRAGRVVARITLPSLRAMLVTTVLAASSATTAFAASRAEPPPPVSIELTDAAAAVPVPTSSVAAPAYAVQPGDCFWSIAETVITAHLGRPPSLGEIGGYWHRLVAANSDRLVHPGVADLIYSGQELALPEP